jgi:hypothetical protein
MRSGVEEFFLEALRRKALLEQHNAQMKGDSFILLPSCGGFSLRIGDYRFEEIVNTDRDGKLIRKTFIYRRRRMVWRWHQRVVTGTEHRFLGHIRLWNARNGFFLHPKNRGPSLKGNLSYESLDFLGRAPSTFREFCCREAIFTKPDPASKSPLYVTRFFCVSSGGIVPG